VLQGGKSEATWASTADAATLDQRGPAGLDITPEEFLSFFGNGHAPLSSALHAFAMGLDVAAGNTARPPQPTGRNV
jgi:hypothetical protein